MMQSRIAVTPARFNWISLSSCWNQFLGPRSAFSTSRCGTADPSVPAVEAEEVYIRPKSTSKSGPKLESAGIAPRMDPMAQQKRRYSNGTKASNLMTKASDEGADNIITLPYDGSKVQMWRPAQMDTAEQSLLRAIEIYRSSAVRGDPDSPHGRILRDLRGEDW